MERYNYSVLGMLVGSFAVNHREREGLGVLKQSLEVLMTSV